MGYAKAKVAKILKIRKSLVQYHADWLEKHGYIRRVRGSKSPILYTRGPNYRKIERKIERLAGKKRDHEGWLVVQTSPPLRYHKIGFRFKVQKPCDVDPPWQKEWQASGVRYREFSVKLENGGRWDQAIRIREIRGKNSSSIVIWLPEFVSNDPEELRQAPKIMQAQAMKVAAWLQKKFGYRLGLPEEYTEPHIAIRVPKEIAEAAIKAGIRTEKVWFDLSPKDHGELETDDLETAIEFATLPDLTKSLADHAAELDKKLVEHEIAIRNLAEFSVHTIRILEKFVESAEEKIRDFVKPDEKRDVT